MVSLCACTALNPSYGEDEARTSSTTKADTSQTTTGSGPGDSAAVGTSVGATSLDPTAVGMTSTSSEPLTTATTGLPIFDLGTWTCEDQPADACEAFGDACEPGTTCRPFDPEGNGSVADTRCLPDGMVAENGSCWPACTEVPEAVCGPSLACVEGDAFDGAEVCRPLCQGTATAPACDAGLCFRQTTTIMTVYGICRGECDPLDPLACGQGEACVIGLEDPVPRCVVDPLEIPKNGCDDAPCPGLTACIPSRAAFDCSNGSCCMDVCDPAAPNCPAEYDCVSFGEAGGPDVAIGFCNPP